MMGKYGKYCAVAFCRNHDKAGKDISFFRFPKEPSVRKEWMTMCKREDQFNANTARVCSDHFTETDFKRDFKADLMGTKRKKELISSAIPSVKVLLSDVINSSNICSIMNEPCSKQEEGQTSSARKKLRSQLDPSSYHNPQRYDISMENDLTLDEELKPLAAT